MIALGLDLSKRSAGFALFREGMARPLSGAWKLGSEYTSDGETFVKLHRCLNDLYCLEPFDLVRFEMPLLLGPAAGNTTADTQFLLVGLAAHVRSYCAAKGIRRCHDVGMATWRKHFIGSMKRGTPSKQLKDYAVERCREFGFRTQSADEAEAIGILDYALSVEGVTPPWRAENMLTRQFTPGQPVNHRGNGLEALK